MAWLYCSPIAVGGKVAFTCSNCFYLPSRRLQEGGGGSTLYCCCCANSTYLWIPSWLIHILKSGSKFCEGLHYGICRKSSSKTGLQISLSRDQSCILPYLIWQKLVSRFKSEITSFWICSQAIGREEVAWPRPSVYKILVYNRLQKKRSFVTSK